MDMDMAICRVCDHEISADEADEYSVHEACMPTYRAQFYAELHRCRRKRRYAGKRIG